MTPARERHGKGSAASIAPRDVAGPPRERPPLVPDPPRPHRWLLVATGGALVAWLAFLLWMALR